MTDPSRAGSKALTRTAYVFSGIAVAAALFAGCSILDEDSPEAMLPPEVVDVSNVPNASPEVLPLSKYGNPTSYVVAGKRYYTMPSSSGYSETGIASWYGTESQGKRTSSGETYDNYGMTAAHRTLPLPSFVRVTNKQNGRSVIVKVNDRGPFHNNRLIELSYVAAVKLGIVGYGTGLVEVTAIDPADFREPGQVLREARTDLYLQAGAFRVRKNAERMRADIEAQVSGPTRIIEPTAANELYTVQVGPLQDAAEAERVASALEPLGISARIHHEGDAGSMAMDDRYAERAGTVQPVPAIRATETTMQTAAAAPEAAPARTEMGAVESGAAAATADTGTSKWRFWQWLPAILKPAGEAPAEAATDVAGAAVESAPAIATLSTDTAQAVPETVAMADDTPEAADESGTSKWKFWQWRQPQAPAEAAVETTVTAAEPAPQAAMVADTAAATASETAAATAVEPEVVAMAETPVEAPADSGASKWKFWQWRPAGKQPAEAAMETAAVAAEPVPQTGMAADTAAVTAGETAAAAAVEPEVVAMAETPVEAPADSGASKWKFWQWRPGTQEAATPAAAEAGSEAAHAVTTETVMAQPEAAPAAERAAGMVAMAAPAEAEPVAAASAVFLQTGAFRLRENAERLRPQVEALAPGAFTIVETDGPRRLYKIRIGPLRDTAEAMRIRRDLRTIGISPSIVDGATGSMLASTTRYKMKPIEQIGKPVAAAPVMEPVKPTRATAVAIPYTRPPAPVAEKQIARVEPEAEVRATSAPAGRIERGGKKLLFQQAGAFARPNNATRLRTRIIDNTREPTEIVQEATELAKAGGPVTLHKVQVGPLENKTEAMRVKRSLIPLGVTDSFPVYRQQ